MINIKYSSFTINVANKAKVERKTTKKSISRKCLAKVILDNGEYKAAINWKDLNNILIIPFTNESLSLKGKTNVFSKVKDIHGHNICVIRTSEESNINPGTSTQYSPFRENLLIAGYIIRKDGKMLFDYSDLVAYAHDTEYFVNNIKIDESKPLFNE